MRKHRGGFKEKGVIMEERWQKFLMSIGASEELTNKVGEVLKTIETDTEEAKILEAAEVLRRLAREEGFDFEVSEVMAYIRHYGEPLTSDELDAVAVGGKDSSYWRNPALGFDDSKDIDRLP